MTAKWSRRFFVPANKVGSNDAAELDCQQRKALKSRNQNGPHTHTTRWGSRNPDSSGCLFISPSSVLSMTVAKEQFFIQQQKRLQCPYWVQEIIFRSNWVKCKRSYRTLKATSHIHQITPQSVLMMLKSLQCIYVKSFYLNLGWLVSK